MSDFADLRKIINEEGLREKQPRYYTFKIVSTLAMLFASYAFLVFVDTFWLQLINAAFLALVFSQIAYIGHDAGHKAITNSEEGNKIIGLGASFLICLSPSWWIKQHNQHHAEPNNLDVDPHTQIPGMVFSQQKALGVRGKVKRFLMGYGQAYYFWLMLPLQSFGMRLRSVQFFFGERNSVENIRTEVSLMVLHGAIYFGLLFWQFNPWQALLFALVHQAAFGLNFGLVFAPNHKGMLILDPNKPLDTLRKQVLTTRNVKPGIIPTFMMGGLNYQIEHHLFLDMPRNNLGKARKIVKAFCKERDVSYHETSALWSWVEIFRSLREESAPLRKGVPTQGIGAQGLPA